MGVPFFGLGLGLELVLMLPDMAASYGWLLVVIHERLSTITYHLRKYHSQLVQTPTTSNIDEAITKSYGAG
jgi:hypothetical protein